MYQAHLSCNFSKAIFNDLLMLTSERLRKLEFWLKVIGTYGVVGVFPI